MSVKEAHENVCEIETNPAKSMGHPHITGWERARAREKHQDEHCKSGGDGCRDKSQQGRLKRDRKTPKPR